MRKLVLVLVLVTAALSVLGQDEDIYANRVHKIERIPKSYVELFRANYNKYIESLQCTDAHRVSRSVDDDENFNNLANRGTDNSQIELHSKEHSEEPLQQPKKELNEAEIKVEDHTLKSKEQTGDEEAKEITKKQKELDNVEDKDGLEKLEALKNSDKVLPTDVEKKESIVKSIQEPKVVAKNLDQPKDAELVEYIPERTEQKATEKIEGVIKRDDKIKDAVDVNDNKKKEVKITEIFDYNKEKHKERKAVHEEPNSSSSSSESGSFEWIYDLLPSPYNDDEYYDCSLIEALLPGTP